MGNLLEGILTLIGILPMQRPTFNNYKKFEKTHEELLRELNGKIIVVKDYHEGCIKGKLSYVNSPANFDSYFLDTGYGNRRLHIHDLKKIF